MLRFIVAVCAFFGAYWMLFHWAPASRAVAMTIGNMPLTWTFLGAVCAVVATMKVGGK
jgi:hypothetical protein